MPAPSPGSKFNRQGGSNLDRRQQTTPELKRGHFTVADLKRRIAQWPSRFRDGPLEGIVIRRESKQWCEQRAKLVRADFTQAIGEHWRSRRLEWNRLGSATA